MRDPCLWDVAVVGAGPAGSAAALRLARAGWSVVILERGKIPRPKACGECVNPGAVRELEALGVLGRVMARAPAPLAGWRIRTARGAVAEGRFPTGTMGLGIPREVLDAVLLEAAVDAGARLETGWRVERVDPGGPGRPARLGAARGGVHLEVEARVVVGADGLRSTLARRLGTLARPPRLRKVSLSVRLAGLGPERTGGLLHLEAGLTVGLAPVHGRDPLWNLTVVTDSPSVARALREDPPGFLLASLNRVDLPWSTPPELAAPPLASGPFDWPAARAGVGRVFLVGDAAGYYDPLTGQGIFRALRGAALLAPVVDSFLGNDPGAAPGAPPPQRPKGKPGSALRGYERALRRSFRDGRRVQQLVEAVVSGAQREPVLRFLARGGRMDALIRVTGDLESSRSLLRPALWLPAWRAPGPPSPETA